MLKQEGVETVLQRLSGPSTPGNHENHMPISEPSTTEKRMPSSASYFVTNRLLPLVHAHLTTLMVRAQTESHDQAQALLHQLKTTQEINSKKQNLARLCGDWRWIIHNHQNHGDHKMVMSFGHSNTGAANQQQPDQITINGDTVHLLWKFPRGRQEDSLLFSSNDNLLEGTFRNSMGPYGNISGKRLKRCKS